MVGILGGGQLGRMMAQACHRLGIRTVIVDPGGSNSPAGQIASLSIQGSFRDESRVQELAKVAGIPLFNNNLYLGFEYLMLFLTSSP